jgi:hypothetical protein
MRCTSTATFRGKAVRCIGEAGHGSAHYTRQTWWPNKFGLPYPSYPDRAHFVVGWLIAGMILTAVIATLVLVTLVLLR